MVTDTTTTNDIWNGRVRTEKNFGKGMVRTKGLLGEWGVDEGVGVAVICNGTDRGQLRLGLGLVLLLL